MMNLSNTQCKLIYEKINNWAEYQPGNGTWACCRDPHVIAHPNYGYIMYYTTWIKGFKKSRLVALGAAISDNLVSWQDAGPVIIREMADSDTVSMESPCVVENAGQYYLFYKHRYGTRIAVTDNPLNFNDKQDKWFSIAHASEIFHSEGKWFCSSCSRKLPDFNISSSRTSGLYLACLECNDGIFMFGKRL